MSNLCIDCGISMAVVCGYCDDCMDAMLESYENSILSDSLEEESNYNLQLGTANSSLNKGSVNREDRIYRVNPQLGCSYCKPNKGENCDRHSVKNRMRNAGPKQRKRSRDIRQGQEFKKRQLED